MSVSESVEPVVVTRCNVCGAVVPADRAPRFRKDGWDVVACPTCGLLFRRELPVAAEVRAIYADAYFRRPAADRAGQGYLDYLADEELHRGAARRRLRLLHRQIQPGRLLDVGCAAGFFMDEARRAGWTVRGVDVSEAMAAHGRGTLGLEIATGLFGAGTSSGGTVDCVTMWDYLEHSIDPRADVERARALLPRGGLLALSTGDAGSLVARLSGRRWHLLTPRHHTVYFSGAALRMLLESAGFEVHWSGHPGARYAARYLAHKLQTAAPGSRALATLAGRVDRSRAGALRVPVNLWDIVTVVARRV